MHSLTTVAEVNGGGVSCGQEIDRSLKSEHLKLRLISRPQKTGLLRNHRLDVGGG